MNIRSLLLLVSVFLLMGATVLVIVTHPERDRRVFVSTSVQNRLKEWMRQAKELYQAKRYSDAERRIRRILEVEPENPDMLLLMTQLCRKQKRYQEAEQCLRVLTRRRPPDPLFLNNLAVVQLCLGKNASARENQEQAVILAPGNPFYLANYAAVLRANDAPEEAQLCAERSRKLLADQEFVLPDDLFLVPQNTQETQEKPE